MPRILTALSSFRRSRDANVFVVFALFLPVMLAITGLVIDYGVASATKTKLNAAADAAAIAAVATAKAYMAANPTDPNGTNNAISAGIIRAQNAFNVNAGALTFSTYTLPPPSITRSGQTFTAVVTFSATSTNHFAQMFGAPTFSFSGRSVATVDLPKYLDFYLLVDVSGSMGLPSTTAGMNQLSAVNHDMWSDYQQGCQFACHFPGYTGWNLAVSNNIQLRSGAVNSAVCSLLTRAGSPDVPNQYRVGIYPFINQMATLAALTGNMATLNTAAGCASSNPMVFTNLLDTGTTQLFTSNDPSTGTGSGGTHFETTLSQMQSTIQTYGDGSSALKPKPFVFIVTDGMQNGQHFFTWTGKYTYPGNPSSFPGYSNAWWDGSQPALMDPTLCQSLKSAGATISILYIPYLQLSFVPNGGTVSYENTKVNGFSPSIPNALVQCASSGYFYTANTPTDITNALNAMFNQAIQVAHLSQ